MKMFGRSVGTLVAFAALLVFGSTADAQLPKRGSFSGHLGWVDNRTPVPVDKDRAAFSISPQGPFFNDGGGGFLHLGIVVCPGVGVNENGRVTFNGYCTVTDKDGDKAFLEWRCERSAPRCVGTFDWKGGTGKYVGLRGHNNSFDGGPIGEGAAGQVVGYTIWKGEWELP